MAAMATRAALAGNGLGIPAKGLGFTGGVSDRV